MPIAMDGTSEPTLRALDPDLSFVASQAAIELDNLLLGKGGRLDAVSRLASYLRESTGGIVGVAEKKHLMDPQTIDLVSRAIDASGGQVVKTIDELMSEAWRIAKELGAAKGGGGEEEIERLRRCAKITSATPSGMIKNACFSRVLSVIAPAPLLKLFLRTASKGLLCRPVSCGSCSQASGYRHATRSSLQELMGARPELHP